MTETTQTSKGNPHPSDVWWRDQGYPYARELHPGLWVAIMPMIFTWRLALCDPVSVFEFWCYPKEEFELDQIIVYAAIFDGKGDPPDGWVKHHPSHRRPRNGT